MYVHTRTNATVTYRLQNAKQQKLCMYYICRTEWFLQAEPSCCIVGPNSEREYEYGTFTNDSVHGIEYDNYVWLCEESDVAMSIRS